jgi:methyltransferase-like protein
MHVYEAPFASRVPERPAVSPLQRLCAASELPVTNTRHHSLVLSDFQRLLLTYLDGTRSRADLIDALESDWRTGKINIERRDDSAPDVDRAYARRFFENQLDQALAELATGAILLP